jgi:hypothetical protein
MITKSYVYMWAIPSWASRARPSLCQTMIAHLSYAVSKIRNVSVQFILQHWELVHVCAIEFDLPKAVGIGGLMLICDASQKTFKEKKGLLIRISLRAT